LHEQDAAAIRDDGADRFLLTGTERGLRAGDPPEELEGVGHRAHGTRRRRQGQNDRWEHLHIGLDAENHKREMP
jgi:hypothetical protein